MQLKHIAIGCIALILISTAACVPPQQETADQKEAHATAQLAAEASMEVGMPGIKNFTEKRLVAMLYELRDQEDFATYTYIVDMHGNLHLFCESMGFGIPYAVQFSNPMRTVGKWHNYGVEQLPQPEPNGLFMPDSLSATWIMCADGENVRPVYVEPQIIVSPFPLKGGGPVERPGG
jgi:hypothetical protein